MSPPTQNVLWPLVMMMPLRPSVASAVSKAQSRPSAKSWLSLLAPPSIVIVMVETPVLLSKSMVKPCMSFLLKPAR